MVVDISSKWTPVLHSTLTLIFCLQYAPPLLLQLFWYHGYVSGGKAAPQERTQQLCNSLQIVMHFIFWPSMYMYCAIHGALVRSSLPWKSVSGPFCSTRLRGSRNYALARTSIKLRIPPILYLYSGKSQVLLIFRLSTKTVSLPGQDHTESTIQKEWLAKNQSWLSVYSQIPASLPSTWEQHWTYCQLTSGGCLVLNWKSHSQSLTWSGLSLLVMRRGKMSSSEYITPNIHTQHGSMSQILSTGVVMHLMISSFTTFFTDSSPCSPLVSSVSLSHQLLIISSH